MSFVGIDDHDGVVFVTLARPPANALACGTLAWAHPTEEDPARGGRDRGFSTVTPWRALLGRRRAFP
jgi:hypothetical protein